MLSAREFFTPYNLMLVIPVVGAAVMLMPMLYRGIVDALMPWKDLNEDEGAARAWSADERRKIIIRRNEERMANAREAWRRGDAKAPALIGRRRSDYEALGIPFPEDNSPTA